MLYAREVDGKWSAWSSWSACDADCRRHRRRRCERPTSPLNDGRHCDGNDLDTDNCTQLLCTASSISQSDSRAVYLAMFLSTVGLVIVVTVVVFVLRRHRACLRLRGYGNDKIAKVQQELKLPPDVAGTKQSNHTAVTTEKSPLRSDNDSPLYAECVQPLSTGKPAISYVLLRPGPDCSTTTTVANVPDPAVCSGSPAYSDRGGRLVRRRSSVSEQGDLRTLSDRLEQLGAGDVARWLEASVSSDAVAWTSVTHRGCCISLPHSGVSLIVPEGAISKGCSEVLFVVVLRDDKDRPKLSEAETMLSPVLLVGPSSVALSKPVVLTFRHCASVRHGQWTLSLIGSNSSIDEPLHWQLLARIGEETLNTPAYVQVEPGRCHVMTDCLMRYALIGQPASASCNAVKLLQIAVFAPASGGVATVSLHNLRVYFVDDTADAFESVVRVERQLGGRLLVKPRLIQFQFGGSDLCVAVEQLSPGWRCKLPDNYQEIPFWHIWSGTQNGLHCAFSLECHDGSQSQLACDLHVFQQALPASRQAVHIAWNLNDSCSSSAVATPRHCAAAAAGVSSARRQISQTITDASGKLSVCQSLLVRPRLPVEVRRQLCEVLDPPVARGNDWRMLAQRLSVDRHMAYFAGRPSPTEHILDLWEARHRDIDECSSAGAVTELVNSLRAIGRTDAAAVIDNYLQQPWV